MQALQRLGIMAITSGLAVCAAQANPISVAQANPIKANSIILEEKGSLSAGDSVLDDGSLYDAYKFSGSSGQQVTINLESQDFDPYLILLDPSGRRISENDDISRTNRNSRLVVTLPDTGIYTAAANSYEAGKNGGYQIKISD